MKISQYLKILQDRYRKIIFDINGRDNRTFEDKLQEATENKKKEFELLKNILKFNGVLE
jgi:hypothetical protein